MSASSSGRQRLKHNRPAVRRLARPPKQRTPVGAAFSAVNLAGALLLQHCTACGAVQYPPRELCRHCLADRLVWRETDRRGQLLSRIELQHSLWEYYRRRLQQAAWPLASVKLDCGVIALAHLALSSFAATSAIAIAAGTPVQLFSHSDCSLNSVLVAASATTALDSNRQRRAVMDSLGLLEPACKPGGI